MKPTIAQIQAAVTAHYNLREGEILSESRKHRIARPRHIAMHLARDLTGQSLPQIGSRFRRHHTTVMSSLECAKKLVERPDFAADVAELRRRLAPDAHTTVATSTAAV